MAGVERIAQHGLHWALAGLTAAAAPVACSHQPAHDGATVTVASGPFLMGSGPTGRATAVELSVRAGTYGHATALALRGELPLRRVDVGAFSIMARPVTNADYHAFVLETGAPEPFVDSTTWAAFGTGYGYAVVERVLWIGGRPTAERAEHPVVLLTREDAEQYCSWWGLARRGEGRLPTEAQWEKAARGVDGRVFPWGNEFDPALANTTESGLGASIVAGARASAASPYGVLDMAGNVFEWTQTSWSGTGGAVVKGGAFNTDAASARAAGRHARAVGAQHPALGFRCVLVAKGKRGSR